MTLKGSGGKVRREIHGEEMRESMHVEITSKLAAKVEEDNGTLW